MALTTIAGVTLDTDDILRARRDRRADLVQYVQMFFERFGGRLDLETICQSDPLYVELSTALEAAGVVGATR